jgi:P22 coat protein - gene protein 5
MPTNQILTMTMFTRRLIQVWRNNIVFTQNVDRRYQAEFARSGAKIGDTVNIRLPARFTVQDGQTLIPQNYSERSVPLTISFQKHTDVEFSSREMTLSLEDWSKRIGEPEAIKLANAVDVEGLAQYWRVYNSIISPAVSPTTSKWRAYLRAGALLDQESIPRDGQRSTVHEPVEGADLIDENKGLFQSATQISEQYEAGEMGKSAGFTWHMDQNVAVHTTGPRGGSPVTVGSVTSGATSINTSTWTAAAGRRLNKGDVFQVAGVFAANNQSQASTGRLRDFTVLANVDSAADGTATITFAPAMIGPGDPNQTVTVLPAPGALLTFTGTASTQYAQNLAYHKMAFTLAMVDLVEPSSGQYARVSDPQAGISMRSWKDSNISTDTHPARVDIMGGWAVVCPEAAVRVWSVPAF